MISFFSYKLIYQLFYFIFTLINKVGQLQHFMASDTIDVTELQQNLALVKATSSGLITSMSEWMDVMTRREEVNISCSVPPPPAQCYQNKLSCLKLSMQNS